MNAGGHIEYVIQHLRDRLAREDISELGVRVETRGPAAHVWGSVTSTDRRAAILRIAQEELAGVPWHADLRVSCHNPPDHPEELS